MLGVLAALVVGGIAALIALLSVGLPELNAAMQDEVRELNRRIFLSPSVQYDNLYAWGDTSEGDEMQKLADIVETLLVEHGFDVLRSDPNGILEDAVALSNRKNIGLHLALHSNAAQEGVVRGCEAFVKRGSSNTLSREIAALLVDEITALGTESRGVKRTDTLYETNHAEAEAVVLLEVDFHDNEEGAKWLLRNRNAIADAIAQAILTYYGDETE